jgi:Ca-activated chloride channel family protein
VFVVDTSGSMEGTSIEQARAALEQGLGFLQQDERFNLIAFSSRARRLFDESMPARSPYLDEARDFIDGLQAGGGTDMAPALHAAMSLPRAGDLLRQIVFITDGSVGNERELLLQIGERIANGRLFTVSIGSAPNAWFMRKAARIGRGSHTHIGHRDEVTLRMASLWARIENPAVQDLCVDWGMPAEYYPEIIPDLYAGEPLWLFARLPREPATVTLCGELMGQPWETTTSPLPVAGSESLATMWARHKIEALQDSRIFGTAPDVVREQVLQVALDFGLLSPYTSLFAVDRTPSRPESESSTSEEVPGLLPSGSGVSSAFTQTATGWPGRLALATLTLLIAGGMLLYLPPSRARGCVPPGDRSPVPSSSS